MNLHPLRSSETQMTFRFHEDTDILRIYIGENPGAPFATFVNVTSAGYFSDSIPSLLTQHTDRHIFRELFVTLMELHNTIHDDELYEGLYTVTMPEPPAAETLSKTIQVYVESLREELSSLAELSKLDRLETFLSSWIPAEPQ